MLEKNKMKNYGPLLDPLEVTKILNTKTCAKVENGRNLSKLWIGRVLLAIYAEFAFGSNNLIEKMHI